MAKATLAVPLLFAITVISSCGGRPAAPQIFSNTAQTWVFQNGYGDTLRIDVIPVDDDHTTWHYTKSAAEAYWGQGIEAAELWFDLERAANGAWYSTGGVMRFPFGCSYCVGGPVLNQRYAVVTKAGQSRPYRIIPSDLSNDAELFDDTVPTGGDTYITHYDTLWQTRSYLESCTTPLYKGTCIVSDQLEGPCIREKWYFAPNIGPVEFKPLFVSGCEIHYPDDPKNFMVRVR